MVDLNRNGSGACDAGSLPIGPQPLSSVPPMVSVTFDAMEMLWKPLVWLSQRRLMVVSLVTNTVAAAVPDEPKSKNRASAVELGGPGGSQLAPTCQTVLLAAVQTFVAA